MSVVDEDRQTGVERVIRGMYPNGQESVEITTRAGIVVTVYVSPNGRSARVMKRKPGKRTHEMKVVE